MNITCPNCKTVFQVKRDSFKEHITKFKCSVCSEIWEIENVEKEKSTNEKNKMPSYKKLLILNGLLVILFLSLLFIFHEDFRYIDVYWKSFYNFFEELVPIK